MSSVTELRILGLDEARAALRGGALLLYPTETLYGLGCDAMNPDAAARVFFVKRRSLALPLPVVISSLAMLDGVAHVNAYARSLMEAFWPGPLTVVLPARREVPDILTGRLRRVAVRFSPHPAARELCEVLGGPVVASSANISGTSAVSHRGELDPELVRGTAGLYASGPEPAGGAPSTVVATFEKKGSGALRILRKGAVNRKALEDSGFTVIDDF